jgi:phospholipid/cholesterol/gamma-HCH transport system substrate-binding protein
MLSDRSSVRVGLLILAALASFLLAIFLIGEQNHLFRPMNRYTVHFANVGGLQAGNPVQLSGVTVGRVEAIVLPERPTEDQLAVRILVDRRYAQRIRRDSVARIQTLGLLGDKFVALTSGSGEAVVVENGGEIEAAPATNVDRLIASGESAVENIVAISASLARLLERLETGDSVLGQLMAPLPEEARDRDVFDTLYNLLDSVDRVAVALDEGKSPIARLLLDEQMGASLERSLLRFEALLIAAEEGDGLAPALLHDGELKQSFESSLANLELTSAELLELSRRFEEGNGLLKRLVEDEEYAEKVLGQLEGLVERLDGLTADIAEGEGTVGRLIQDPEVYQAINDVIVGVNESRLLRWLIRNRQKAGIEKRYRETRDSDPPTRDEHP